MAKKRLIATAIAVLMVAVFLPGFSKLQELREENRNLERRIEVLTRVIEELDERQEKLKNDLTYVEKVARDKLGMVRKGEIVIKDE